MQADAEQLRDRLTRCSSSVGWRPVQALVRRTTSSLPSPRISSGPSPKTPPAVLTSSPWMPSSSADQAGSLHPARAVGLVLLVRARTWATCSWRVPVRSRGRGACALGATQTRLLRQALAEAVLIAASAAIVGIGLAVAGVRGLVAIAPADVPRLTMAAVNLRVLAATLGLSLFIAVAFSLLPTLQARRLNLRSSLADGGGRGSAGAGRRRIQARS